MKKVKIEFSREADGTRRFEVYREGEKKNKLDEKRAELEAVKKRAISIFIDALKKELDRVRGLGLVR